MSIKITTTTVKSSDGKISFTAIFETSSLVDLEWIEKGVVELKERLQLTCGGPAAPAAA